MRNQNISRLIDRVVRGGYCIGCGACAATPESGLRIALDTDGKLQAGATGKFAESKISPCSVCPFSGEGDNEDALGKQLFGEECEYTDCLGYHRGLFGGYVTDEAERIHSASGGITTWLLTELLRRGDIDGVAHVRPRRPTDDNPLVLSYVISTTEAEIRSGTGSHYYPVEMSEVLKTIRATPGRYAVVGVPRFITAVRLLMKQDPIFNERIAYCIGIIAGHMKSKFYADTIGWQQGILPGKLSAINFRKKRPHEMARNYDVEVEGDIDGSPHKKAVYCKQIFNHNDWGLKFFEYEAADFSDDLMAETADISLGDAWLPRYMKNWRGASLAIVRNQALYDMLQGAAESGKLRLDTLTAAEVLKSQAGGLRHLRRGVHVRAQAKKQQGKWHPPVRRSAGPEVTRHFPGIIRMRSRIARESFAVFHQSKSFAEFNAAIQPFMQAYDRARSLPYRIAGWLRRHVPFL